MDIKIHTTKSTIHRYFAADSQHDAYAFLPGDGLLGFVGPCYMARVHWQPVPASRFDRLVGDVWAVPWRAGTDSTPFSGAQSTLRETCLVTSQGKAVYRIRGTDIVMLDCPAIRDEIMGRLPPDPVTAQGGTNA